MAEPWLVVNPIEVLYSGKKKGGTKMVKTPRAAAEKRRRKFRLRKRALRSSVTHSRVVD
jgi:hypothetical protein